MADRIPGEERVRFELRKTVDAGAERMVFQGIFRQSQQAFPAYAREGLTAADFFDPDAGVLYEFCRARWEADIPNTLVTVFDAVIRARREAPTYRGLVGGPFGGALFHPHFAVWLAECFTENWWPDGRWATAEFADGRNFDLPHPLCVATVAARWVHLQAERRRRLVAASEMLDAAVRSAPGELPKLHRPDADDDWVETRGPA